MARRRKTAADVVFAVFCASVAVAMLRQGWQAPSGWLALGLAIGGCATRNAYWLFARALFRGAEGLGRGHLAALGIAVLIVAYRLACSAGPAPGAVCWANYSPGQLHGVGAGLHGKRCGWSPLPAREAPPGLHGGVRRLRADGCGGSCADAIAAGQLPIASLSPLRPGHPSCSRTSPCCCAARSCCCAPRPPRQATAEDQRLARILRQFEESAVDYRQPELKVADLARRVGSAGAQG